MKEQTKEKMKNYGLAIPLIGYSAVRLAIEEIIPEKVSGLLGRRYLATEPAEAETTLIEKWPEFVKRKEQERRETNLGLTAVTADDIAPHLHLVHPVEQQIDKDVVNLEAALAVEPPTDTHPIAA